MRILYGLVALAAIGIGVVVLASGVDTMRGTARTEAQNDRIAASNRVIDTIRALDTHARECADWLVGLTTGTFQDGQLKPRTALQSAQSCDTRMIKAADKAIAAIAKSETATDAENARPFFTAARDLTASYRAQSEDFREATDILTTAFENGANLASHKGAVADLVNRRLPAINEGLARLDETSKDFIYPDG